MAKATLIEPFRGLYGKLTIKKSPNGRVIMNPAVWLWIGSSKRVRVGRLAWHPIVLEEVAVIPGLPITAAQLKPTTSIIPDCGERGPPKRSLQSNRLHRSLSNLRTPTSQRQPYAGQRP